MSTLEALQDKLNSAEELQTIVKMMKSLAAANIHQYENAVASLSEHSRTLELGWQILLLNTPDALTSQRPSFPHQLGLVVFGSDQGMCGRFNQQLTEFIGDRISKISKTHGSRLPSVSAPEILAVGTRIADSLLAAGYRIDQVLSVPISIAGITPLVQRIVMQLEAWRQANDVDHIWVIHNRPDGGTASIPSLLQLLPLSYLYVQRLHQRSWGSRCRPQIFMNRDRLFSALFQQHFFIGLYRACAESLASENASRLTSMQIAEKNIDDRLDSLKVAFQQKRQDVITSELLDIISGFEALNKNFKTNIIDSHSPK